MKNLLFRLAVGLITFFAGVCAAILLVSGPRSVVGTPPLRVMETPQTEPQTSQTTDQVCARLWNSKEIGDEHKAVIAAQGFVLLTGYTNGTVGSANMAFPCVEGAGVDDDEESSGSRYDTLEDAAYGVSHVGRSGSRGWTVVFRYTERMGNARRKTGRAVTMDENFRNLRVEHCDFFLDKVEKKLKVGR